MSSQEGRAETLDGLLISFPSFSFPSFFHTSRTLNIFSFKTSISQLRLKRGGQWDIRECHRARLQESYLKWANSDRGCTIFVLALPSSCCLENGHDRGYSSGHTAMSESEDDSHVLKDGQTHRWKEPRLLMIVGPLCSSRLPTNGLFSHEQRSKFLFYLSSSYLSLCDNLIQSDIEAS